MTKIIGAVVVGTLGLALGVGAVDVPVAAKKIVIVDKTSTVGTAKIVYVAKDGAVTKGPGTNAATIDAVFEVTYSGAGSVGGGFVIPAGVSNGTDGWKVNKATVAKYVNKAAPGGPTGAKVAVIKPGKLLKIVGKSQGDVPLDIVAAGAPSSGLDTVYTVTNDGAVANHCSTFPTCVYKLIGGGTGAKLVCKNGTGSACPVPSSTTTTTVGTTTTTTSTIIGTTTSTTTTIPTTTSTTTTTTSTTAPSCSDLILNGDETDVDCGGSVCPKCGDGDSCIVNADCTSSICSAFICQAPSCSDGVQNGTETDVDCGGSCPPCTLNKSCNVNADCQTASCTGGLCKCPVLGHIFQITSNTGGSFDSAEWPGGTQNTGSAGGCSVTIRNPSGNIDLVGLLGDNFGVQSFAGYSNCFGTAGEDGDGCSVVSCPPAGIGSCEATRPSCSAALNGSGTARYQILCLP